MFALSVKFVRYSRNIIIQNGNLILDVLAANLKRGLANVVAVDLPSSATLLQNNDEAKVVLLGTVHFSKQSVEDVSQVPYIFSRYGLLIDIKSVLK